ncbi:ribose-phosphate diphosphokinase [Ideonella sp. 4Y16]|uniref:ribose-phosphate diphosphokinase n=1 Tax=Ideonella alba TaxID=2824118 RepID=UPI001B360509|nr:ribose-phosphate diphosphokinase [Ideonella alba]MBQ0943909.1 ribose-phosphate diphosphokinase [Ideonella alba]
MIRAVLAFDDEQADAGALAQALGAPLHLIGRHRFPDGELRLTLPTPLAGDVVLYRSLHQPNEKLVELLIAAPTARAQGAGRLWLVAPYLAYMRQDIAFNPGEAISQRHIGALLARTVDGLVTVDPHLHRIAALDEVMPGCRSVALSAAPSIGAFVAAQRLRPLLLGPDSESAQWVQGAARAVNPALDHAVCQKVRHGDHEVRVTLPAGLDLRGREVVLVDDMASTGRTLVAAALLALAGGATRVDVAVTHALFVGDALAQLQAAGIGAVWSTGCVPHASNAIDVTPLLADALQQLVG